jgi:hypothetical protein
MHSGEAEKRIKKARVRAYFGAYFESKTPRIKFHKRAGNNAEEIQQLRERLLE